MIDNLLKTAYGNYLGFDNVVQQLEECAEITPACESCFFLAECQPWFDSTVCRFHSKSLAKKRIKGYFDKIAGFIYLKQMRSQIFILFYKGLNVNEIAFSLKGGGFNISSWTVRRTLYPGRPIK